ncbi:MAG: hypothetical protein HUU34_13185 [Saprospiraceae bacterium]|jgi:hypothetical protein|nr:hypothetical protein [Saprospiraceae bacterium]
MNLKYETNRYLEYKAFVAQIVENVRKKLSNTRKAEKVGNVLYTIANMLLLGTLYIFSAFYALLMAGAIAFYGGLSALFATNPILGTIMLTIAGILGVSVFKLTKTLFEQKEIFTVVKQEVIEKYEESFNNLKNKYSPNKNHIPQEYANEIESLIKKGENSMIESLIKRANLKPEDFLKMALPGFLKNLFDDK